MNKLLDLVYSQSTDNWTDRCTDAFNELFGSSNGRYPDKAKNVVKLRAPKMASEAGIPFASFIHPSNPDSGAYGGMCFVIFPIENAPCLVALGIGTQGLNPDEEILSRPGHGRKSRAISNWINKNYSSGDILAWSKHDPVRTDIDIPANIKKSFNEYEKVFAKYGKVLYSIYKPDENRNATKELLAAFMDLMFEERGITPLTSSLDDYERLRSEYFKFLSPEVTSIEVVELLNYRQFVILEGPPGTGKTRMATKILNSFYQGNGTSIQFHPNTTYENFIGGLFPVKSDEALGFSFAPKSGDLMNAVKAVMKNPQQPYLLHIDEINRADLSKILGEAIFLFESKTDNPRKVKLAYDFGAPIYDTFTIPHNLHILGTMNTADRSIAIVDVAVRRRFAFIKLWPQMKVVETNACELMKEAYIRTVTIFVEYANEEAYNLIPGHSYFLELDEQKAIQSLKVDLVPLLEEYLAQGYVTTFADAIRGHIQWIDSLSR